MEPPRLEKAILPHFQTTKYRLLYVFCKSVKIVNRNKFKKSKLYSFTINPSTLSWQRSLQTSPLIWTANQWTDFYMIGTTVSKKLTPRAGLKKLFVCRHPTLGLWVGSVVGQDFILFWWKSISFPGPCRFWYKLGHGKKNFFPWLSLL